jgi:hypothetical protein
MTLRDGAREFYDVDAVRMLIVPGIASPQHLPHIQFVTLE